MLKSHTVWYEEVDRGLVKLLKSIFKDVPIKFYRDRKDDLDPSTNPYTRPSYPYIRIIHLSEQFDKERYNRNYAPVLGKDLASKKVTIGVPSKPYILNYQIEIITDKMSDKNRLTMLWNSYFIDVNSLEVLDMSGEPRKCPMIKSVNTTLEQKSQKDSIIFRSIFKYKIKVEIDEPITRTEPMVTSVKLEI